jgi:hypothetical protein
MADYETPRVRCMVGEGDRPLSPITHPLIITKDEAKARGFAELYDRFCIKHRYPLRWPYRPGDENIRRNSCIRVSLMEFGLRVKNVRVLSIEAEGEMPDAIMSAVVEWYEARK